MDRIMKGKPDPTELLNEGESEQYLSPDSIAAVREVVESCKAQQQVPPKAEVPPTENKRVIVCGLPALTVVDSSKTPSSSKSRKLSKSDGRVSRLRKCKKRGVKLASPTSSECEEVGAATVGEKSIYDDEDDFVEIVEFPFGSGSNEDEDSSNNTIIIISSDDEDSVMGVFGSP